MYCAIYPDFLDVGHSSFTPIVETVCDFFPAEVRELIVVPASEQAVVWRTQMGE